MHIPDSGLCPECRTEIEESLTAGRWRSGVAWDRGDRPRLWALWSSTIEVLAAPRRFYSRMLVRDDDRAARRFCIWQFRMIALGAVCWFVTMSLLPFGGPPLKVFFPMVCVVTLLGWAVWRLISTISTWWWYLGGSIPDPRWSRKVVQYESAFLWAFCLFNGSGVSFMVGVMNWAPAFGKQLLRFWFLGTPFPFVAFLAGNATLGLIGLYRYRIALRAIRWANF